MKVATQNLISIVPIFLLLAIIASLLLFLTEQREVRWGLEAEAQGLAVAIAEFVDPAAIGTIADGTATASERAHVRAPIDRILAYGAARRVELFRVSSGDARPVLELGERAGVPDEIDAQLLRRLTRGEDLVERSRHAADRLVAHAPIRDGDGALRAIVSVETSLAPLAAHRANGLRRTIVILLALLVAGCLVSLALSTIITRGIGRLTRTARAFVAGDYDARLTAGPIEEVAEVGSTFGIMGAVLKDATLRSTREMLQFERVSTEANLAERFAARFAPRVEGEYGGVKLAIDRLGAATHGDFWFVRAGDDGWQACLGRVAQPASFEAVLTASACATLLQDGLARGEAGVDLLTRAAGILPIHCCVLLEWSAGAVGAILEHRVGPGVPPSRRRFTVPRGRTMTASTLDPAADRGASRYADAHAFDSPSGCLDELRRFFGEATPGGVLVLQVTSR